MKYLIGLVILFKSYASFAYIGIDQCADINNQPVLIQQSTLLNQAAEGRIINGTPTILIHPGMMSQYPQDVQQFILAHECSHHRQGHVVLDFYGKGLPLTAEYDADCMAVRTMKDLGLLNQYVLQDIQNFLRTLMADSTHPAGTYRAQFAEQCAL